MIMNLIIVKDKNTQKKFLDVPRKLYKNDPNWVCPLDTQIESLFDPKESRILQKGGEAVRYVLEDAQGRLTGRIAAFINPGYKDSWDQPTGGIGFFECINNQEAANLLFDKSREWLQKRGMEAMDGPINFGANHSNWGLLVDGFVQQGLGMNYNFPYYRQLFENYGFKIFYEQYTYHIDRNKPFPERFWRIAEWISNKPHHDVKYFSYKEIDKFSRDFSHIYNNTWPSFKKDFEPLHPDEIKDFWLKIKLFVEEEYITFGYIKDEPVAFFITIPDINQVLKYLDGRLNVINKLKLFYYTKINNKITRIRGFVFGIIPKYQKTGIDSVLYLYMDKALKRKGKIKEVELSWVGDFNPHMRKMWQRYGATKAKTFITYRYLFDRNAEFKRYPIPETKIKDTLEED